MISDSTFRRYLNQLCNDDYYGVGGNYLGAELLRQFDESPQGARTWLDALCSGVDEFIGAAWPFEILFEHDYESASDEDRAASDAYSSLTDEEQHQAAMNVATELCNRIPQGTWLLAATSNNPEEDVYLALFEVLDTALDIQHLWSAGDTEGPHELREALDQIDHVNVLTQDHLDGAFAFGQSMVTAFGDVLGLTRYGNGSAEPAPPPPARSPRVYPKPPPAAEDIPAKTARRRARLQARVKS